MTGPEFDVRSVLRVALPVALLTPGHPVGGGLADFLIFAGYAVRFQGGVPAGAGSRTTTGHSSS